MSAGSRDAPEGSGWRRHRRRSRPPWGKMSVAGLVLLTLAGGWWWFARGATDGVARSTAADTGAAAAADSAAPAAATGDDAAGPAVATDTDSTGSTADDTAPPAADAAGREEPPPEVPASAPELGYSVLVASYAEREGARERAAAWAGDGLYVVAPTAVDGETYWRLYRGAVAGREAGQALNRRLVEAGRKTEASPWDVRPAGLAFRIATYRTRGEAAARSEELAGVGVAAYTVPAAVDGDTVWQVYAGAYEDEAAAAPLRRRLEDEGVDAELVTRRGEPADR